MRKERINGLPHVIKNSGSMYACADEAVVPGFTKLCLEALARNRQVSI